MTFLGLKHSLLILLAFGCLYGVVTAFSPTADVQCAENEVYNDCKNDSCVARTCDELGFPLECLQPDSSYTCEPGCVCRSGYLKDSNGKCIQDTDCPCCGTDCNAGPGCSNYCTNTCSNYNNIGGVACPDYCLVNGCACKKGYVYSEKLQKCVSPDQCAPTPQCKENEVYNNCSIICPPQTCASINSSYNCPLQDGSCTPGCDCIFGYLRNGTTNSVCIPTENCPIPTSTDEQPPDTTPSTGCSVNKVYNDCGSNCPARCPSKYKELYVCTQQCVSGCFCISGTVQANDGSCIDPSKCPPIDNIVETEE